MWEETESMDGEEEEEDADPVVKEIPVFLSKPKTQNLYLFQYPVRPTEMPYQGVQTARMKPKQKRIELVVGVDSSSSNYDRGKGEQISINAGDALAAPEERLFAAGVMNKQTLASTLAVESTSRFAAGILLSRKRKLDEGEEEEEEKARSELELHLTPLDGIAQLRPSYDYLDAADVHTSKREAEANSSMDEEEEEEAQQVIVRYSRGARGGGRGGGGGRGVTGWRRMQRKLEEEPWVSDIRWHGLLPPHELSRRLRGEDDGIKREEAEEEEDKSGEEVFLEEAPTDYIKALMPSGLEESENVQPAMPSNVLSLMELKRLSTSEAITTLLTNAKVMRLSQILQLLPQKASCLPQEILRLLQQVAVLIQGCWVVKSEVLYPEKFCSRHSGVGATLLCRGRDYMLWKFTQSRHVIRKDIQSTTKLPAEDVLEMLEGVARMRHGHGWHFRLDMDTEFCTKHPDIVARQTAFWSQRVQSLINQGLKINVHAAASAPEIHAKPRNRLNSEVSSSDESDGGRRASHSPRLPRSRKSSFRSSSSPKMTKKGSKSKTKGGASPQQQQQPLSNSIRSLKSDSKDAMEVEEIAPRPGGTDAAADTAASATLAAAANALLNGDSKSGCHPEFRHFIAEKVASESLMKLSDLKRMFQYRLAELHPGSRLGEMGFNEKMVEAAVVESGGVRVRIPWPKGSDCPEEPLYAILRTDDDLRSLRPLVLRIFAETGKCSVKTFRSKLEEIWRKEETKSATSSLPEETLKRLRSELCVSKASAVFLKGTLGS